MTQAHGSKDSLVAAALAGILMATPLAAQQDLRQMSLEELMTVEVTTVARRPASSMDVPAAVYVITAEDIRRSGAPSLPEALRLAPGMQVARIDAGKWSVGIRGFADRLARSMLVLIDGRPVYSPLFAGTYWETQHVALDDVERIEVIRGPGGTLWGSNAVNGIVSIVTRTARETQGLLVSASGGTEGRAHATVRYGATVGDHGWVRGYVAGLTRPSHAVPVELEYDGWQLGQAGFRFDSDLGVDKSFTLQGDIYSVRLGQYVRESSYQPPFLVVTTPDSPLTGGNVTAQWTSPVGSDARLEVRAYYDRSERDEYPVGETRNTASVDAQVRHLLGRHRLVWGAAYQLTSADIETGPLAELPSGTEHLPSAFVEDEISMASERLRLTLGAKMEHNTYSGWEVQPSVRAAWLPSPAHTTWGAITRAVRRPTRVERSYRTTSVLDPETPAFIRLLPNPDFKPEVLTAYEIGYRALVADRTFLTVSGFYNQWHDLLSTELDDSFSESDPPAPDRLILPVAFRNGLDGSGYGAEVAMDARPAPWWRAVAHYSFLRVLMTPKPGSTDITQESRYEEGSPRHQLRLQNSLTLPHGIAVDWHVRRVSELPDVEIPSYTTSDVRIGWAATNALSVELMGRNLHEPRHPEWPGDGGPDVLIERTFYLGFTWQR